MKNTHIYSLIGIVSIILLIGLVYSKQSNSPSSVKHSTALNATTPTRTNSALSADPQDIVPGTYPNPIINTATTSGLTISSGIVENNVDAQGKVTNDHLEITLKNTTQEDMGIFEVYYKIIDLVTAKNEGYYKKLTGFTLKAGESKSVHFDGMNEINHFGVNKDGLYFTSKNKLQFDIQVSTPGFQIAHIQILKDAGGAEVKD